MNYYIYAWFNIETFEIFYIGLGKGDRRFHTKQRNKLFKNYIEINKCAVRLFKTGLNEEEARQWERILIEEFKPCCNMTRGGERTNGKKISESLKGRTFSDEHKKKLSTAAKKQWTESPIEINNKSVTVYDSKLNLIKKFDAKYHVGIWLHNEFGYGKHARSAQRIADKYFKTKELFDNRFYFVE